MSKRPRRESAEIVQMKSRRAALADLPPSDRRRWTPRRKAEVVAAVERGVLSEDDACERYDLTLEEFASWKRLVRRHGQKGLRVTQLQKYQRPYTDRERNEVRELWRHGPPSRRELAAAAVRMERSVSSLKNMAQHLGASARNGGNPAHRKPAAKPVTYTCRKCLRCRDGFESWGAGNRLCDRCRASNDWAAGMDYAIAGQP